MDAGDGVRLSVMLPALFGTVLIHSSATVSNQDIGGGAPGLSRCRLRRCEAGIARPTRAREQQGH